MVIASGGHVEYDWDHRNRLVSVSFHNSQRTLQKQISYTYDVDQRIAREVDTDGSGPGPRPWTLDFCTVPTWTTCSSTKTPWMKCSGHCPFVRD